MGSSYFTQWDTKTVTFDPIVQNMQHNFEWNTNHTWSQAYAKFTTAIFTTARKSFTKA